VTTSTRSAADLAHRAGGAHEGDLADLVAGPLGADGGADFVCDFVVGGAIAQQCAHVEFASGEETRAELALCGEAQAVDV
jgi:hypothetical protein